MPRLILTASLTVASYQTYSLRSSRRRCECCAAVLCWSYKVRFGGFPDNVQLAKTLVTEVLEGILHSSSLG